MVAADRDVKELKMNDLLSINSNVTSQLTGSCLCGGVKYSINGPVRNVVNCFCSQCRKTSGHHVAATKVIKETLTLENEQSLKWYECLPGIHRGFCSTCGGNLFWDKGIDNQISIMAGTLDPPTHLKTVGNIFTEDASDYCEIPAVENDES